MYPTSSNYKTGIYATERMNKGRVTFDISDTTAVGDVQTISSSAEFELSKTNDLIDKVRQPAYKMATMEKDRFKLDGTWTFAEDDVASNGEVGWTSDALCDENGIFAVPPQITFNFSGDHSSIGLTISFEPLSNEYATDFTMTAFDASNNVIASYPITGNTESQYAAYGQLSNYRKVVVTITKWSVPNRRARVSEVDFGIVKVYTGETGLVSMELNEEVDITSGSLPSPEFKFVVDNSTREFNILNPVGFYKSLQQKQQVLAEIGLTYEDGSVEWVPVGNYLLQEWQSDEGSLTSSFYARTKLDLMSSFEVENSTPLTQSLAALATWIFDFCGITNYYIDPALENITTTTLIKKTNCKNILQMIALAGCAVVYVTRDNVITLKCPSTPITTLTATASSSLVGWAASQAIDGNALTLWSSNGHGGTTTANEWISLDAGTNKTVTGISITPRGGGYCFPVNFTIDSSVDGVTWATVSGQSYTNYPRPTSGAVQNFNFSTSVTARYIRVNATVLGTDDGGNAYFQLTDMTVITEVPVIVDTISLDDQYAEPRIVLENPVKQVNVSYYTDLNTAVVVSATSTAQTGDTLKMEGNTLISDATRATAVANWIIAQKNNRATYTMNWRGNQSHEQNDIVAIGNSYGTDMSAYVTRTNLKYEGYVQATTEARGVAN